MPGFAFWGLFLVFGVIVVLYTVWMFVVEAREARGPREARPPREAEAGNGRERGGDGPAPPGGHP